MSVIKKGNTIKNDGVFILVSSAVGESGTFSGTVLRDVGSPRSFLRRSTGDFRDDWISDDLVRWELSSLEEAANAE
jgi:hypothetical protein